MNEEVAATEILKASNVLLVQAEIAEKKAQATAQRELAMAANASQVTVLVSRPPNKEKALRLAMRRKARKEEPPTVCAPKESLTRKVKAPEPPQVKNDENKKGAVVKIAAH